MASKQTLAGLRRSRAESLEEAGKAEATKPKSAKAADVQAAPAVVPESGPGANAGSASGQPQQSRKGKKVDNKCVLSLFPLVLKMVMYLMQETRRLAAVGEDVFLVKEDHPLIPQLHQVARIQEQQKRTRKKKDDQDDEGEGSDMQTAEQMVPLAIENMDKTVEFLAQAETTPDAAKRALASFHVQLQDMDLHLAQSMVRLFVLRKCYKKRGRAQKYRITLALSALEPDVPMVRKHFIDALVASGAERRTGVAPPQGMESIMSKMMRELDLGK
eukprot:TRINITY_DN56103_c0_g1_i1.p1 TRINITY_DN56103_c0_g1~~TRINITY_DN56103_c0_g1_i1.p1  ORF type:complete len:273 (+),score=58.47 TRINITY_DN56103_c0_g1_i1:88-906(+)